MHSHDWFTKAAAQLIKTTLDKKFGAAWHCAIGEGFGFDVTYQAKNMVYIYYGSIGILAYKCWALWLCSRMNMSLVQSVFYSL